MALTNWNDILNKPNGIDEVPEIALTVEQLSASVLSLGEDVGEIAEDVQEIALEVSQLSASTIPFDDDNTIKEVIEPIQYEDMSASTFDYKILRSGKLRLMYLWFKGETTSGNLIELDDKDLPGNTINFGSFLHTSSTTTATVTFTIDKTSKYLSSSASIYRGNVTICYEAGL